MYRPKRYTYVYFKTFCSQYRQMNKLQVLFIGGKSLVNTTHTVLLETLQAYPAFLITICIQLLPTYKQKTLQDLIQNILSSQSKLKMFTYSSNSNPSPSLRLEKEIHI